MPVFGSKTPMLVLPLPSQSATTGSIALLPKPVAQISTVQPSKSPLPLASRNHWPVLGRKTPILAIKGLLAVWLSKVAVQLLLTLMLTLMVAVVALQPVPVQLTKLEFVAAAAVSTTVVPLL